jgi:hypothetical protein
VPTTTPPDDLIRLKARYLEADAQYREIRRVFPTGQQIAALLKDGLSPAADEQAQRAYDAYQECIGVGRLIQAHAWWRTQPSRADADRALTEAARAQLRAGRPAASAA